MAGVRFADLQSRPTEFLDLTSVTLEEFPQLVPSFETAYHARMEAWCMDGKPRTARRFTVDKNCPLPTPEDRLLFILTVTVQVEGTGHAATWVEGGTGEVGSKDGAGSLHPPPAPSQALHRGPRHLTRDQARDLMRQILAALLGALVADGLSKWLTRAINEG